MTKPKMRKNDKRKGSKKKCNAMLPFFIVSLTILAVGIFIPRLFALDAEFTQKFYTEKMFFKVRNSVGYLPSKVSVSFTEISIGILLHAVIVGLIIWIVRIVKGKACLRRFISAMCAIIFMGGVLLNLFNLTDGLNYYNVTLDKKLSLEIKQRTDTQLYGLCVWLRGQANTLRKDVSVNEKGIYCVKNIDEKLKSVADEVRGISEINPQNRKVQPAKKVYFSGIMTMLGIQGIYMPFFAEANINADQPSLMLLSSAAHENAHSLGIAREDEANFAAYLACMRSDDADIRYSGIMLALSYASSRLYKADTGLYKELINGYDKAVINDLLDYNDYWHKDEGSIIRKISDSANDAYLKYNGSRDGLKSYGAMTDLLLSYYEKQNRY